MHDYAPIMDKFTDFFLKFNVNSQRAWNPMFFCNKFLKNPTKIEIVEFFVLLPVFFDIIYHGRHFSKKKTAIFYLADTPRSPVSWYDVICWWPLRVLIVPKFEQIKTCSQIFPSFDKVKRSNLRVAIRTVALNKY